MSLSRGVSPVAVGVALVSLAILIGLMYFNCWSRTGSYYRGKTRIPRILPRPLHNPAGYPSASGSVLPRNTAP